MLGVFISLSSDKCPEALCEANSSLMETCTAMSLYFKSSTVWHLSKAIYKHLMYICDQYSMTQRTYFY